MFNSVATILEWLNWDHIVHACCRASHTILDKTCPEWQHKILCPISRSNIIGTLECSFSLDLISQRFRWWWWCILRNMVLGELWPHRWWQSSWTMTKSSDSNDLEQWPKVSIQMCHVQTWFALLFRYFLLFYNFIFLCTHRFSLKLT
jgi:hypothetical protein